MTRAITLYEHLTGFRPRGKAPYRVLLDYGPTYVPNQWVEHVGAHTLDKAREQRRKLGQWPSNKVRIVDITELAETNR